MGSLTCTPENIREMFKEITRYKVQIMILPHVLNVAGQETKIVAQALTQSHMQALKAYDFLLFAKNF